MNCSDDISVIGFSSVGAIVSLLLADNGIEHSYYMKKGSISPLKLAPLSNPLVNGPTQHTELPFIPKEVKDKIKFISIYNSKSFDKNFKHYHSFRGKYITPTYAVDNRIRHHVFLEKIKKSDLITLIESSDVNELPLANPSQINIVGGQVHSHFFDDIQHFPTNQFMVKRDLFFFNLNCEKEVLEDYSDVNVLYIDEIGEVLIYPFLHVSGKVMLNITVNVIKTGRWDLFNSQLTSKEAFALLLDLLSVNFKSLERKLRNCSIADNKFRILNTNSYYKYPVKKINDNIIIGVGDVISKSDPLLGQGYNSGVDLGSKLVDFICNKENNNDSVEKLFNKYAVQRLEYLYYLNRVSTQGNENKLVSQVYQLATTNLKLSSLLFSTYDDISLYFPWLIDEKATVELLKKYADG